MIKDYNDELKEIWDKTHKKDIQCLICFGYFEEGKEYADHKKMCVGRDLHNKIIDRWFNT